MAKALTKMTKAELVARIKELEAAIDAITTIEPVETHNTNHPAWIHGRRPIKCTRLDGSVYYK